ncbi:DNA-methyltransferase [Aureimonas sp. AU40]|uniref:DNA-methyltransferase n=1 Tax=Aureimonas sp. AU40 TaxID=1637747 RepID=UPI00078516FB|nr:site-specific DNA-methyltransferase [Aureimonas sp. AU40]
MSTYLGGRIALHPGDCLDRLRLIASGSVDAIVTDPPYALTSIVNRFGKEGAAPAQFGTDGAFARASRGFMGKEWDTGERAFSVEFWQECYRVLKPGGHVVAFSGTRTYHHIAVAIEGAGFDIRDQLAWVYGTGFPKSHNVSKAIDKKLGAEPKVVSERKTGWKGTLGGKNALSGIGAAEDIRRETRAATPQAAEWEGWGTALKPAWEPIVLARKSLDGTVAENCLAHGTGALNVGACKVGEESVRTQLQSLAAIHGNKLGAPETKEARRGLETVLSEARSGRFPANLLHDGSEEVVAAFPAVGEFSASRFFYSAKADGDDRHGLGHPTIKPVDVMRWCIRLVCRRGGTVLDPFAGTGTTGEAAYWEGCNAILVEREEEYQAMIAKRMSLVLAGPDEKKRARTTPAAAEGLPLFAKSDDKMQTSAR